MTRQVIFRYVKKGLFWLTYAGLMGFNLIILAWGCNDLYYEIFDPVYWRDHMTMHPYVEVEIPTPWQSKLELILKFILPVCVFMVWGNYRLYKKKKYALWILAVYVYVAVGSFLYIDVLGLGEWCPGHDFP